jgi:hypothetical protein
MSYRSGGRAGRSLTSVALLLLVGQIALGLLLPVAEARAQSGSDLSIHIESESDQRCAPTHDPMVCSFCRLLASKAVGSRSSARATDSAPAIESQGEATNEVPSGDGARLPRQARAPPASAP